MKLLPQNEIMPEMMEAGNRAVRAWLKKWDYLEGGMPPDYEVVELVKAVLSGGSIKFSDKR